MRFPFNILTSCLLIVLQNYAFSVSASHLPALRDSLSADCIEPVTWRIGSIDPRFNIDQDTLKYLMTDVQQLWAEAVDKTLIEYSDSGTVAIHLIYSKDQEITDEEKLLSGKIRKMKRRYYSMKIDYELNQEESQELNLQPFLDYEEQIKNSITQYNNRFSHIRTFRNAIYYQTETQKKVNIYHIESIDNLRLVLAHEFGHALGLSHAKNPLSVMYHRLKLQNDKIIKLTDEDIQAIQNKCST